MSVITQINSQPLNPVLQRKNRKKLGALSTNCCIIKLVDLATQSGWDHEDARKTFAEGYVCLTCYRTVEKVLIFGECMYFLRSFQDKPMIPARLRAAVQKEELRQLSTLLQ